MQFDQIEWDEKSVSAIPRNMVRTSSMWSTFLTDRVFWQRQQRSEASFRSLAIGMLDDVCVVIIFTLRGTTLRVISMRKARQNERKQYHEKILSG